MKLQRDHKGILLASIPTPILGLRKWSRSKRLALGMFHGRRWHNIGARIGTSNVPFGSLYNYTIMTPPPPPKKKKKRNLF